MKKESRDPLILAYKAIQKALKETFGKDFIVRDAFPDPSEIKKILPSSCVQVMSGSTKKSIMSDYEVHKKKKLSDGNWLICTENLRFYYLIKISFFADKMSYAQSLSNEFMSFIEKKDNYIDMPDDHWNESMLIYINKPPLPPKGQQSLYKAEQDWCCRGKLLIDEIVPSVDISKLKFNIKNF